MTNIIQTVIFSLGTLNLTIGIVILLSLAANKLFGKRYSAGCRYIVWTLIILRLCIPLSVDTLPEISKLSLPESITIESKEDHIPPVGNTDVINKTDSEISSNNSEQSPEGGIHFDEGEAVDTPPIIPNGNIQNNVDVSVTVPSDTNAPSKSDSVTFNTENILKWMFWCWLTVAAIIFTVRISGYVIYSRRVRKNITPADSEMCELLRHVADDMGLNTGSLPPLYFTDSASSPMLFGFTKTMILLPSLCRYDVELKGILSHELVHYRRKDLWIKLACVFAVSLNWFNPLVYIAAVKASREMELSCDEKVLKKYDNDARISYSRSMLRVVEQCCSGHSSLTTQFDPKKSAIVERFAGILDSKKKKRGIVIIAIVLLTCIMSTGIVLWQMEPDPIPSPDSETTGDTDTEDFEESNSENTAEPDKTEPEDIQTEPIETEPYIDTSIDTSATAEPEPTETQPNVEQPTETQSKTYICTAEMFTKDGFLTQPEYIPALTLNDDGTLIFRVYYIGGVTDVPGTYEIEDNHIYIDCVLEGTPVYGFFPDGGAWMDNKFMFEIVDEDTLIFYGHPDDTGDVRCYTVEPGDVFKRGTQPIPEPIVDSLFDEEWITQNTVIPDIIPEFEQGDMIILPTEDFYTHGIHFTSEPLYRSRYYDPGILAYGEEFGVSPDKYLEFKNIFMVPDWEAGAQPEEMYFVTGIKYLKIPKDVCQKIVDYWWSRVVEHNVDDGTERYEIPNLDIIYTFDNDIINNYYLRDQSSVGLAE